MFKITQKPFFFLVMVSEHFFEIIDNQNMLFTVYPFKVSH